jgi:DNA-binding CsgD family transcriptional regulator
VTIETTVRPIPSVRRINPARPATRAVVDATVMGARRDVLVGCSAAVPEAPLVLPRPCDEENLRRGVRYRMLYPDRARSMPRIARQLGVLAAAGAEIRTAPSVPVDALVVDGSRVLLPRETPAQGPCGLVLFQLPSIVTTTVELFDRLWATAVPWNATEQPSEHGLNERERALLTLLSAGCTDVTAASRLGVSVRTVRRAMADMMNRLGARSRFQAGVKAVDRGWIEPQAM